MTILSYIFQEHSYEKHTRNNEEKEATLEESNNVINSQLHQPEVSNVENKTSPSDQGGIINNQEESAEQQQIPRNDHNLETNTSMAPPNETESVV